MKKLIWAVLVATPATAAENPQPVTVTYTPTTATLCWPSTGAAEYVIHNWRWNQYTQYAYLEVARTSDTCWSVALPKGTAFGGNSGMTKVTAEGNPESTASAVVVKNPG